MFGSAALAIGIFIGLDIPVLSHALAFLAFPALFVVVTFSLVPLAKYSHSEIWHFDPITWRIIMWQQGVLPTLILLVGHVLSFEPSLLLFMLVTATGGSLFAAPAIISLLDLDHRLAFRIMAISTVLTPATTYVFLTLFTGTHTDLDGMLFLEHAIVFLVLPLIIFGSFKVIFNRLSAVTQASVERLSGWITIASLIIFGIAVMDPVTYQIAEDPRKILLYLAVATGLGAGMFLITIMVFGKHGGRRKYTAGILIGFRNIGLSYGLIGNMLGEDFAVYVGVAMLPTFVVPFLIHIALAQNVDSASQTGKLTE